MTIVHAFHFHRIYLTVCSLIFSFSQSPMPVPVHGALSLSDRSQRDHEKFLRKRLVLSTLRRKCKLKKTTHSAEWNFGWIVVRLQSKFDNDNHHKILRMVQTRK